MSVLSTAQAKRAHAQRYAPIVGDKLIGPRYVIKRGGEGYPEALCDAPEPPDCLYVIGNVDALDGGLSIIGARKATPYGRSAARLFAGIAAEKGICVISGGALGCDSYAHEGALAVGGRTVAVLGGGCDQLYPASNAPLFQQIIDAGGAVVSEHPWDFPPLPYTFRARNRIIAGLARATLIVEAGLPSGTFSTADDALACNRDVLVVPGPITSPTSRGANRLIYQGATPIIDKETFQDALFSLFGCLVSQDMSQGTDDDADDDAVTLLDALNAEPLRISQMIDLPLDYPESDPQKRLTWITVQLAEYECKGLIEKFPDGRYGPARI